MCGWRCSASPLAGAEGTCTPRAWATAASTSPTVWLLLSYMGMETMPERMQRPELPAVGDTGALVKTPTDEDMDDPVGDQNV